MIRHLIIDEGEGVVARSPRVRADQEATVCLSLLREQVDCLLEWWGGEGRGGEGRGGEGRGGEEGEERWRGEGRGGEGRGGEGRRGEGRGGEGEGKQSRLG